MERPFLEGDVITSQGANAGFEEVRPGVLTVTRYAMTDSSGELVAELVSAGIVRGATLQGTAAPPQLTPLPEIEPADKLIWEREIEVPPDAAHVYTECADIYNPIHTERRVALAAGLPDIILHGSATQAIALSALVDGSLDGNPARVRRFYAQNRAMVLMNTRITVRCLGEQPFDDSTGAFAFDVLTEDGATALARRGARRDHIEACLAAQPALGGGGRAAEGGGGHRPLPLRDAGAAARGGRGGPPAADRGAAGRARFRSGAGRGRHGFTRQFIMSGKN